MPFLTLNLVSLMPLNTALANGPLIPLPRLIAPSIFLSTLKHYGLSILPRISVNILMSLASSGSMTGSGFLRFLLLPSFSLPTVLPPATWVSRHLLSSKPPLSPKRRNRLKLNYWPAGPRPLVTLLRSYMLHVHL